jgi:CubicO group peptidase (beta-lactamase class C family)
MKTLIPFFIFFATISCMAQTNPQPDFSNVKAIINDRIANHQVPSVSIAVVKGGKIIWEESFGYADKENQRKATIDTPYNLASISKTITATAIMKLAEEKRLNVDYPVNNYLKGGKVNSPMFNAEEATVKRVMSHTSGLTTFNFWCRTDSVTCARIDDDIINRYSVLVYPPGDHFDYSNLGYGVLDRVISNTSGKSFAEYMKAEIFSPLGMKNSYVAEHLLSERAMRYGGGDASLAEYPYSHLYTAGASFIYSSVHDLALFAMLHLNDLKKKSSIISGQSIKAMQDTVARNGSLNYGLGWWINQDLYGYKGVLAQGGTYVSSAWLQLIPSEDIGVVVLTNIGHGEPWRKIINEVLSELLPKFKANLALAQSAKKETPAPKATVEPPFSKWKGILRTYKGDVPVALYFNGSKGSFADLGDVKNIPITEVKAGTNSFAYRFAGDLGLEDVGSGPYNLAFYLTQKEDVLYGHVETHASVNPGTPLLPFWVMMKKE